MAGTSVGLSITYDIVTQQHRGTIAVESGVGGIQRVHGKAAAQPVSAYERTTGFHNRAVQVDRSNNRV